MRLIQKAQRQPMVGEAKPETIGAKTGPKTVVWSLLAFIYRLVCIYMCACVRVCVCVGRRCVIVLMRNQRWGEHKRRDMEGLGDVSRANNIPPDKQNRLSLLCEHRHIHQPIYRPRQRWARLQTRHSIVESPAATTTSEKGHTPL